MTRVAVLKGGRSLERQVSLKSGVRVQDALHRLGHDVVAIDVGHDLVRRLRAAAPEVAFVALHGRDGEDGTVQELLEALAIPYTGSGVSACIRCADKVIAKNHMLDAGIPTPDFFAFNETAFKELGAADALPAIEERLGFPLVVKPAGQGSALGIKFAAAVEDVPGALVAAFSYGDKVLLERHVKGRDLAVSVLDGEALPVVEAVPADEAFYDFEARYEIGRTRFVCPAELPDERDRARAGARAAGLGAARLPRLRADRPHARRRDRRADRARGQRDPGDDGDLAAAAGGRRRGDRLRRADRAHRPARPSVTLFAACGDVTPRRRSPPG